MLFNLYHEVGGKILLRIFSVFLQEETESQPREMKSEPSKQQYKVKVILVLNSVTGPM